MIPVRGHNLAKMGLEAAVWDLLGQAQGRSLAQSLGGVQPRVAVGLSIGVQGSVVELLERIAGFWAQGYSRVKIKIRPGWDVEVARRLAGLRRPPGGKRSSKPASRSGGDPWLLRDARRSRSAWHLPRLLHRQEVGGQK